MKTEVKVTENGIVVDDYFYSYEVFNSLNELSINDPAELKETLVEAFFDLSDIENLKLDDYVYVFYLLQNLLKKLKTVKYIGQSEEIEKAFVLGLETGLEQTESEEYYKAEIKKLKKKLKKLKANK